MRPLRRADLPGLPAIDPGFVSHGHLDVTIERSGLGATIRLAERPLDAPFVKGAGYGYDPDALERTRARLETGESLQLVAERDERLVAVLEVEPEAWRGVAQVHALYVDVAARGLGLGRALMDRAARWARERGLRALAVETQTNNVPALRFYQRLGFELAGVDARFYGRDDVDRREVAVFLYLELSSPSR